MKNKYKVFYISSLVFFILFIIKLIKDILNRETFITVTLGFAIKVDILLFLVPAIILLIMGVIIKKKNKTE